jgi:transcriptional regulator with XRE-family HTH domain
MSVAKLAERAHLTPAAIRQWENRGRMPRSANLRAIADALDVPASFFAGDAPQELPKATSSPVSKDMSLEELIRSIEAMGFSVEIKPRGTRDAQWGQLSGPKWRS